MNEQNLSITVTYTLAEGRKIEVEVSLDAAAVLRQSDSKIAALLKQDKRYLDFTELDNGETRLLYPPEELEDLVERLGSYGRLHKALDLLTEIQRRRVKAHFFMEQSYAEIAGREGVSEYAVRESINNALRNLRKILSEHFGFDQ